LLKVGNGEDGKEQTTLYVLIVDRDYLAR